MKVWDVLTQKMMRELKCDNVFCVKLTIWRTVASEARVDLWDC